jgi:hypothetical protein
MRNQARAEDLCAWPNVVSPDGLIRMSERQILFSLFTREATQQEDRRIIYFINEARVKREREEKKKLVIFALHAIKFMSNVHSEDIHTRESASERSK